ncbi:MAG: bis(5'-nucleosyl)-tetraphosphatase (symmetrical) YqeK [Lachnospiraceae bacterium]|jgi:predicted HD superfamily hydrolase involved in NAD metabolism|nr:bis(5'-nucleosyl)-tetraphosphatase (symmetrical) YqeK [Lachnospiraceae bacterium]MDD4524498.1 bis(5'-nucleosyl)-tetraphosphatase (symmetrical) YqeK [Lachnospiraceae bacterium]
MDKTVRVKMVKALEKELNYKRFIHTMGVAYTATALAMRYGADVDKAEMAGLLHDCAKCKSIDSMQSICRKAGASVSNAEKNNPALLHSKAGAILARTDYEIEDNEILSAIMWHTTGKPDMSLLDKIVFISDYIEPTRCTAPRLPEMREAAFRDIDEALIMILEDTLSYLKSTGCDIDLMTEETYEYYINKKRLE